MSKLPVVTQLSPDARREAAQRAAEAERERIREEARAEGVKIGERHKAFAYAFAGAIVGAFLMGVYTSAVQERGMFTAGAVADRIVARTVEPGLPATINEDRVEEYLRNTEEAREQACREGVRGRDGRCPREPANAP
jgi:hypothetical protein